MSPLSPLLERLRAQMQMADATKRDDVRLSMLEAYAALDRELDAHIEAVRGRGELVLVKDPVILANMDARALLRHAVDAHLLRGTANRQRVILFADLVPHGDRAAYDAELARLAQVIASVIPMA